MKRMIDPDQLVRYLKNEVHAGKAAAVVEKFAAKNAVVAIVGGEKTSLEGYGLTFYRDGSVMIGDGRGIEK